MRHGMKTSKSKNAEIYWCNMVVIEIKILFRHINSDDGQMGSMLWIQLDRQRVIWVGHGQQTKTE